MSRYNAFCGNDSRSGTASTVATVVGSMCVGAAVAAWACRSRKGGRGRGDDVTIQTYDDDITVLHGGASDPDVAAAAAAAVDAEERALVAQQLSRNTALLGDAAMHALASAFVVVVGLGGVGSHAAAALVRAGVGHVRLIDFDQVSLSSLNRHASATRADVGISKVRSMRNALHRVFPGTRVEAIEAKFDAQHADALLCGDPTLVLDCIDNTPTKVELIQWCCAHDVPVIASMGAGARMDPTRIQVCDISETITDPLAKEIRSQLRRIGIRSGVPVIVSTEKPVAQLVELAEDVDDPADFAILPNFRTRIMPVIGTLPAMFGNVMATVAISRLSGRPDAFLPRKESRVQRSMWATFRNVIKSQLKPSVDLSTIQITYDDAIHLMDNVWFGRSALSEQVDNLALCRWDPEGDFHRHNVILVTAREAKSHQKLTTKDDVIQAYGVETVTRIDDVLATEKAREKAAAVARRACITNATTDATPVSAVSVPVVTTAVAVAAAGAVGALMGSLWVKRSQ